MQDGVLTPLASDVAKEVFDDFTLFEKSVAQVDILGMILKPAWSEQTPEVLAVSVFVITLVRSSIPIWKLRPLSTTTLHRR